MLRERRGLKWWVRPVWQSVKPKRVGAETARRRFVDEVSIKLRHQCHRSRVTDKSSCVCHLQQQPNWRHFKPINPWRLLRRRSSLLWSTFIQPSDGASRQMWRHVWAACWRCPHLRTAPNCLRQRFAASESAACEISFIASSLGGRDTSRLLVSAWVGQLTR